MTHVTHSIFVTHLTHDPFPALVRRHAVFGLPFEPTKLHSLSSLNCLCLWNPHVATVNNLNAVV